MPIELRKLVFTGEELLPVIRDYCVENGIHIPNTPMEGIEVHKGPPISIALKFPGSDDNGQYVVEVDKNRLLVSFIRACKVLQIPLPRNEDKHLAIDEHGIALVFGSSNKMYKSTVRARAC